MPLSHPSKSKFGSSNQIQLYQAMDTSPSLEDIQQLTEIHRKEISWKHDREYSRQSPSTTFHCFFNVLGMILQPNHSMATTCIRSEGVDIRRHPFKGRSSLAHSKIFSNRVQTNAWAENDQNNTT
jgi:hypothetical protein